MPTISSMARNNYMMLNYALKSGNSLFDLGTANSKSTTAATSLNYLKNFGTSGTTQSEGTTAVGFKTSFDSTMKNLSSASNALKNTDFDVGGKEAVTQTTDENGKTTTKKSDKLVSVLKGIESFAESYNDAIDLFNDNANSSKRVKQMANVFADTKYRQGQLSSIGVVVGSDGKMKLDEDVLTKALTENPTKVNRLLGRDGLAGKADSHVSFARSQESRMLTSFSSVSTDGYSSNGLFNSGSYGSLGNLFSMWI